jgi:hypothetical protein
VFCVSHDKFGFVVLVWFCKFQARFVGITVTELDW